MPTNDREVWDNDRAMGRQSELASMWPFKAENATYWDF